MRPPKARLLEVAWGIGSASQGELSSKESHLVQLPDCHIPGPIQKITGLQDSDLLSAVSDEFIFKNLQNLPQLENVKTAIIHYSQFENAFFSDLFLRYQDQEALPFEILCSAKISRKLFPALPSANIRAVAGYLGASTECLKRSASHVAATYHIWKSLVTELSRLGLTSTSDVQTWLLEKKPGKKLKVNYEYRIERSSRLSFPEKPGIYRMRNKQDQVLYVGKAKSLRSRVNSYFRGQKGRDRKKMEMLAQVWTIEYVECTTPLEAALLETDEIKRLNPPYNVYLKDNRPNSVFYDRHFLTQLQDQDQDHNLGPFRPNGNIETLRLLCKGLLSNEIPSIFHTEIAQDLLSSGFLMFCFDHGIEPSSIRWVRDCIAIGLRLLSAEKKANALLTAEISSDLETELNQNEEIDNEQDITIPEVAAKFKRLFLRAGRDYQRSRKLTRLLNCRVEWVDQNNSYSLNLCRGKVSPFSYENKVHKLPWLGLDLGDYDRMCVLLSEMEKYEHKIVFRC